MDDIAFGLRQAINNAIDYARIGDLDNLEVVMRRLRTIFVSWAMATKWGGRRVYIHWLTPKDIKILLSE